MTLKQAFTIWAYSPGNTVLAAKSREAVQRVLMKKWNDIGLEQFTEQFCRRIFYQSTESLELKVKAASILVYVLQWGSDNGHCQRPTFTLAIAREEHERAEKDKAQPDDDSRDPLEGIDFNDETKTEEDMEQKKTRGKQARKICQIDAETLQVIKTYDSCSEGCRAAGVKNIDRAIKRLQLAGGYYWQYPEDVATFADRLAAKRAAKPQSKTAKPKPKVESDAEKQQANVKNNFPTAVATLAPTPKPDDAPNVTNDNQRGTAAHEALEVFTDDELLEELDRRGWQGELRKVQIVTIGTK